MKYYQAHKYFNYRTTIRDSIIATIALIVILSIANSL